MTAPTSWRSASFLTIAEAARVLGVPRSRAHAMAASGELPTFTDAHGRLRVRPSALEAMTDAQPTPEPDLFSGTGITHRDRWLVALLASDAPAESKALGRFLHDHMDPETGEVEPQVVALLESIREGGDE